jgi:hypothetical protein
VPTCSITPNKVTKSNSLTCKKDKNTDMKDKEEITPLGTPRLEMGSNDVHHNTWDLVLFSTFETKIEKIIEIKKI